jgi:hypothetical protein
MKISFTLIRKIHTFALILSTEWPLSLSLVYVRNAYVFGIHFRKVRLPILIYISRYKSTVRTIHIDALYNAADILCLHPQVSSEISFLCVFVPQR